MAPRKTSAQRRVEKAPASAFRKLSKTELGKLGLSLKSERYVETGKRVTKNTLSISKRSFTVKQRGMGPEALAEAHAEARVPYLSKSTQAAAEKQRKTRLAKPLSEKRSAEAQRKFERDAAKTDRVCPRPEAIRKSGKRAGQRPAPYNVNQAQRSTVNDLFRRKLAGEWIAPGEWHMLMDFAHTTNSPYLSRLMIS